MKKLYFILILNSIVLLVSLGSFAYQNTNSKIIGTWVGEDSSPLDHWVFTSDAKLIKYVNNEIFKEYTFSISSQSCNGENDRQFEFLHLTNINDSNDMICYLIHGITENTEQGLEGTYLSLEFPENPRPIVFKKQ